LRTKALLLVSLYLWVVFSSFDIAAQERSPSDTAGIRVCVFLSYNLSSAQDTEKYKEIITDALEVELKNLGLSVVPREEWREVQWEMEFDDEALVLGANAVRVSRRLKAQLAVTGFYSVDSNRILLQIKCYNVKQDRLIAGVLESGRLGVSLYNLISQSIVRMRPKVVEGLKPLPPVERLTDPRLTEVELLSADEGAEVYLNGEELLGTVEEGRLGIYSIKGTDLHLELKKGGFHPRREVVHLEEKIKHEHKLTKLVRETRWASEILYTSGQMLGLGFGLRYYFLPDELFVSLEDYLYVQHAFRSQSQPILHNDIRLLAGRYLFLSPYYLFRFGVSTGLGVIITGFSVPDIPVCTDFYINAINGWVELNFPDWILYFRVEAKYGVDVGENLLGGRWHLVGGCVPPMTLGAVKKW
jgi:hypothetical protein